MATLTPQQAQQQLKRLGDPRALGSAVESSIYREAHRIVGRARDRAKGRGVLRSIFGRNDSGLKHLIQVGEGEWHGSKFTVPILVKGFAAIQEEGLRTRSSGKVIKPGRVKALAFKVPGAFGFGGDMVFSAKVKHRGATHPRMPSVGPEIEAGVPGITKEIVKGVNGHINRVLGS